MTRNLAHQTTPQPSDEQRLVSAVTPLESEPTLPLREEDSNLEEGEADEALVEADLSEEEADRLAALEGTAALWERYQTSRSAELSALLVNKYLPFVTYLAERAQAHLSYCVELGDLIQDGTLGLLDAMESYQPELKIKFETFAGRRIKGAMLDGVRAMDWVPRLDRQRSGTYNAARAHLEMESGREPTQEEIAARLNLPQEDFEKARAAAKHAVNHKHAGDFRRPRGNGGSADEEPLSLDDVRLPIDRAQRATSLEKQELFRELTRGISAQQRDILNLYLYEEVSLKEIGEIMDLGESRVSQLFTQTLRLMTEKFSHARELPRGNILRELVEEFGDVRGVGKAEGEALSTIALELLGRLNSDGPVKFELTGGKESFSDGDDGGRFERLIRQISANQPTTKTAPPPTPATPNDSGFTFFDGPATDE
ncbi:MAG: sigma-70 family RNA polymerase sigma factor [Deltaproteobacteria bacterium]|nr:sigma-70 family RNA polymerase sigma factor [Deltaproteobacteria bacterium]